jgi:hypothetical protein
MRPPQSSASASALRRAWCCAFPLSDSLTNLCHAGEMPLEAPVSYHLDLYRYWLAKRGDGTMPARSDLNPGDVLALLPYLTILEKADGRFRYRLVGSATAREVGRDLTGSFVGSYVSTPESAAAVRAVCERVFTAALPNFATGEFKMNSGAIHNVSQLILPLSDDGVNVNMAISTLLARFNSGVSAKVDWLKGLPVEVDNVVDVNDAADLEKLCLDWERHCRTGNAAASSAG